MSTMSKYQVKYLQLKKVSDGLQAEIDRLKNMTYCAYCGIEFPLDDEAANQVSEHIRTCDKHPLRELEATADRRLALLRRYEWVDVFIDNGGYRDKWIKQCLCCKSERDAGHADGCELAEELR